MFRLVLALAFCNFVPEIPPITTVAHLPVSTDLSSDTSPFFTSKLQASAGIEIRIKSKSGGRQV